MVNENEIPASANPVKYHGVDYHEDYITVEQHRTRRRIPNGYWFEDTGTHIYISVFYSHIFQHKRKIKKFIVNTVTKEWRDFETITITKHIPKNIEPIKRDAEPEFIK